MRNNERDDTSGGGSGKTTPRKRGAMAGAGSGVERARAEAGKSAEKEPAVAESDATKPSESDKTAAAEAVKSAEDTAAELIPASAEKSADTETTPADGAGPVEGEPAFDAEERKKAMIKSAEKSLRERFGVLRDVQNKSRNEQRTNGSVSTETQTALTAANGEYQTAQFTLNELRKGLDPAPSNETRD